MERSMEVQDVKTYEFLMRYFRMTMTPILDVFAYLNSVLYN